MEMGGLNSGAAQGSANGPGVKRMGANLADHPTVSVIIPVYNRAAIVPRAITSVLAQTFPHWELIIVDDGSTDSLESSMKALSDPRIRYIRHGQNRGQSAAQNSGIKMSRGTYVALLDSDDEWFPAKLARDLAAFQTSNSTVGLVYCGKEIVDENDRLLKIRMPTLRGSVFEQLLAWDFIGSCSRVTVKRDILESAGGFDESFVVGQDWDMWLRVARISEIESVNECLVRRHLGPAQVSGSLRSICEGKARIIEKYRALMPRAVLAKHMGNLAVMLNNYEAPQARKVALEALRLRWSQPMVLASLGASLFGRNAYRWMFSRLAKRYHGIFVGRAAI
jgi:Glycosyl transferase family 2